MRFINPSESLYGGVRPAAPCPYCGGYRCCAPNVCRAFGSSVLCTSPLQVAGSAPAPTPAHGAIGGAAAGAIVAGGTARRIKNQSSGPVARKRERDALLLTAGMSGALMSVMHSMANPCSVSDRDEMCGVC